MSRQHKRKSRKSRARKGCGTIVNPKRRKAKRKTTKRKRRRNPVSPAVINPRKRRARKSRKTVYVVRVKVPGHRGWRYLSPRFTAVDHVTDALQYQTSRLAFAAKNSVRSQLRGRGFGFKVGKATV